MSLRDVEDQTKISNAYLSQLERGEAENPSPEKLERLARCYDASYESLMNAAGYLTDAKGVSSVQAALMSANLTPEEEEQVLKYVKFLRSQE